MTSLNVFVTESNVEIYLTGLYKTLSPAERDNLLRLLVKEEAAMGTAREHVENGERRVIDGRDRLERQRLVVATLAGPVAVDHPAIALLETLERTQQLLEQHLRTLRNLQKRL